MELSHLQAFVIVAQEENLTRAAENLYLTPSALSMRLSALETELGLKLFVRSSTGMQLTADGEYLLDKATNILLAAQSFHHEASGLHERLHGTLEIGLNAPPGFLRVAEILATLQSTHPELCVCLHDTVTGKTIDDITAGRLDAGFIYGPTVLPIRAHLLTIVELVIAIPHRLVDSPAAIEWETVSKLPWIYDTIYCPFQHLTDGLFAQHGLKVLHRISTSHDATKRELVSKGVGVALLEKTEAEHIAEHGDVYLWSPQQIASNLGFAYLQQRENDPLIREIAETVLAVWQ